MNDIINVTFLENEIKNIMCNYSFTEAIYCDILKDTRKEIEDFYGTGFFDDIKNEQEGLYFEQWKNKLSRYHMSVSDFISNTIMAILSEINNDTTIENDIHIYIDTYNKVKRQQDRIISTKQDIIRDCPEFKEVLENRKRPPIYQQELCLSMSEYNYMIEDATKLFYKLAIGDNINNKHFSGEKLNQIISCYKQVISYLKEERPYFIQMMIIYHLEVEIRFSMVFHLLMPLKEKNSNRQKCNMLSEAKKIFNTYAIRNNKKKYQNIIYFGKNEYSKLLSECVLKEDINGMNRVFDEMYTLIQAIFVIRDSVMYKLKECHKEDYNEFINNTYTRLEKEFNLKCFDSEQGKSLLSQTDIVMNEYMNFEAQQVKISHFIQLYSKE